MAITDAFNEEVSFYAQTLTQTSTGEQESELTLAHGDIPCKLFRNMNVFNAFNIPGQDRDIRSNWIIMLSPEYDDIERGMIARINGMEMIVTDVVGPKGANSNPKFFSIYLDEKNAT